MTAPAMPPTGPPIAYTERLVALLDEATTELHRLAAVVQLMPGAHLLGAAALRSSSLAWASLEGDPADLLDVLRLEAGDVLGPAAQEPAARARDRQAALREGLDLLAGGAALDGALLSLVRHRADGERGTAGGEQGSAAGKDPRSTGQLVRLLHDRSLPFLVRVALAQRRAGRPSGVEDPHRCSGLGPVLVPLALAAEGALAEPVLRLPCFFAAQARRHHELLATPSPEPWVRFFLDGVRSQAQESARWMHQVRQLQQSLQDDLVRRRASATTLVAADHLVARPYLSAATLSADLGVSGPTARAAIEVLVEQGVLVATSRRRRDRFYVAPGVLTEVYGHDVTESLGGDSNP